MGIRTLLIRDMCHAQRNYARMINASSTASSQDLGVGDLVLPGYATDLPKAAHVELFQPLHVGAVSGPCFSSIEQSGQDHGRLGS